MKVEPTDLIWMNGEFVSWEDAKVHVLTHGLHYGTGVFEGVRCYDTQLGPAVFRNADHVERLFRSADLYYMDIPFTREQLLSRVWGYEYYGGARTVDVHVRRLRAKLRAAGCSATIGTVRGVGYRFDP